MLSHRSLRKQNHPDINQLDGAPNSYREGYSAKKINIERDQSFYNMENFRSQDQIDFINIKTKDGIDENIQVTRYNLEDPTF